MMDNMALFLSAAITVEGIIYYVKAGLEYKLPKSCMASIALGIFVAVNFGIDAFDYINLPSMIPFAGNVLTGILLSRGANYCFDTLGVLSGIPSVKK